MRRNLARFAAASAMAITVLAASCPSAAGDLSIAIAPSVDNPADPQMGDHLVFETRLTNTGATPVLGVISWLSIVRVDPGQEAPIGLEDWQRWVPYRDVETWYQRELASTPEGVKKYMLNAYFAGEWEADYDPLLFSTPQSPVAIRAKARASASSGTA